MAKIGDRCGAVMSANDGVVIMFGYGVYAGDFIPPENSVGFGPILNENKIENPRIDLDNGKSVFGCECWWDIESEVKKRFNGYKVEIVNIDNIRNG